MRAIVIPEFGGPEVLKLGSVPDPTPSSRELLVRVCASGVNRADLLSLGLALDGGAAWDRGVMEATGGRGADVILDLMGAPYLGRNQAAIAVEGRHVVVGVPGGSRAEIDLRVLMARRAHLFGTVLRARGVEEKAAPPPKPRSADLSTACWEHMICPVS